MIDNARQLLPSEFSVLRLFQSIQHRPAPLLSAQVHDAGARGGRDTHDVKIPGEITSGQGAVRQDAGRALPIGRQQSDFILEEMAQGVANGPRTADQLLDFFLSADSFQAAGVILSQGVIVPTNGSANLEVIRIDSAGGVMRGRNTAGHPVLEPA